MLDPAAKVKLSLSGTLGILMPYVRERFMEQVKSVWFIIFYLVAFQILVLRLPIVYALMISAGVVIVILGLMFFMEGLMLGLMPFAEVIGSKLPQKSKLPVILLFAFLLGIGATFAEPAIAVLKHAGKGVTPTAAPLLYSLLNDFSNQLVFAVGTGVGIAVLLGVLRFLYGWSLKLFIVPLVLILAALTYGAHNNEVLNPIIGLAWDCGAVTTGPVTVPLVLALGIGVCRIVSEGDTNNAGFGIVTLASLFPIIAVMLLGMYHYQVKDYYGERNYQGEMIEIASAEKTVHPKITGEFTKMDLNIFRKTGDISGEYTVDYHSTDAELADGKLVLTNPVVVYERVVPTSTVSFTDTEYWNPKIKIFEQIRASIVTAGQAIIPLCLFLLITLKVVLREKIPHADEIFVGIFFAVLGMALLGLGITLGLTSLGQQLGNNIPAAFTTIELVGLSGFQGPLYGEGLTGKMVAIAFAFFLGYGATLAEPALRALGVTVETITVGAFKRSLLIQTVAIGVGAGIAIGVGKIAYNLPLAPILLPAYLLAIVLTVVSSEEFVNFGWDSAGVTTGPITVPLILAMGLGIGANIPGVIDGFGVLALASVAPIIAVLGVGIVVSRGRENKQAGTR